MIYAAGTRIEMILMEDDPCPIPPGSKGTVMWESDLSILGGSYKGQSQLNVNWDNGRTLGVCLPKDKIKVIT